MKPFCATWACSAALMCLMTVTSAAVGPPRMPPRRVLNRRELYYKDGGRTRFPCEATGDPQLTYRWTRNGQNMKDYASGARFEISSKTGSMRLLTWAGDEGQYRCLAENSYGVAAGEIIWLVRAQLGEFKSSSQTTFMYITASITLESLRPTSVPDHGVHWVTMDTTGQHIQVKTDDRVIVDQNGDLHFTNVVEADNNKYYCVATNFILGKTRRGLSREIDAIEGKSILRSPVPMFVSPNETVGLRGESVKLQCIFSGNPTPKVEWLKVFGPLPVGRHETTEGGVLEITDLEEADAAVDGYRCVVRDSTGNVEADAYFSLVIEAAPYMIDSMDGKIDSMDGLRPEKRAEGETASFDCLAAGNPSPSYEWYINGVSLDDVTDRRIAGTTRVHSSDPSRLAISNLTTEDTMAIQCKASNKHGYLWDNTFITISDKGSPPFIYTQWANQNVWFKPNSKVELPCKASGIPQPEYKWMKNGNDLVVGTSDNNNRIYQVAHEGSLVINEVQGTDEGYYECVAINDNGVSASDKVRLRIAKMDALPVPSATKKHRVDVGAYLKLPCLWPVGGPNLVVSWLYKKETMQGWKRLPLQETIIQDLEGRLHFIDVSESNNLDLYRCKVENEILEAEVLGQVHEILVQTGQDVERTAPFAVFASPQEQLFLVGDTMKLQCIFGGHPTPNIIWTRDGGKPLLDEKDRIGVSGTLLEIPAVRYSDAGNYSCVGNNSADGPRADHTINVRVESKPTWWTAPRSQTLPPGGKASFRCEGNAEPETTLTWFVNGVPFEEVKRQYGSRLWKRDQDHDIGLNDLTLDDDMTFQCNVSNKHGYLWANVYLDIDNTVDTGDTSAAPLLQAPVFFTLLLTMWWFSKLVIVGLQL